MRLRYSKCLWRAGAAALSATAYCVLLTAQADARATYTTVDAGFVTSINSTDAVTGYSAIQAFVRTPDGIVTRFDVPGGSYPEAWSINDQGEVTGFYQDSSGLARSFFRAADGSITTFSGPKASGTVAYSINNKGAIVGRYRDDTAGHGFLRAAGGHIRTIDVVGAVETDPASINDRGTISGSYLGSDTYHGFVRTRDGTITTFDVPGASSTFAGQVNINGTVVGDYDDGSGEHGFMRASDGTITTFDYPGCFIEPFDINRHDVITGVCQESDNPNHFFGFLRRPDGRILLFHVPEGGASTMPMGINDSGVIAGEYKGGGFLRFP